MDNNIPSYIYKKVPFKKCLQCNRYFTKTMKPSGYLESKSDFDSRKYCTKDCSNIALKDYRSSHAKTNKNFNSEGREPPNKGKFTSNSYSTIHKWLASTYGKTGVCQNCHQEKKTCWALIGKEYTRNREDYAELCYSCHNNYDLYGKPLKGLI